MSDEIKEKVSAFLDGELDPQQLAVLTDRINNSPDLRGRLNRYVLISESIKGNSVTANAQSIADSVSRAIEDEPAIIAPVMPPPAANSATAHETGWKTWFAGGAIAATVATLALINFDILELHKETAESFPVTAQVQPQFQHQFQPRPLFNSFAQPASTQWSISRDQVQEPELERELNQFLIEHSEYTHQSGMPGLVPYATFVVYDKK